MSIALNKYKTRITPLKYHPVQSQIIKHTFNSNIRFSITPAGRRSGKTEIIGKRRLVQRAVIGVNAPNPRYFVSAPTRDQVKRLYWDDLKTLTIPFRDPIKPPSESHLIIYLKRDREIHLLGMDKPERIEGSHWDGGVLDEYGNMKKSTWPEHVRPALSTPGRPPAWVDFIGVPEGRNHYYDLFKSAKAQVIELGDDSFWMTYHWFSSDILDPKEIENAKRDLDDLTFAQEFEGSFINFSGRAYYNFNENTHCAKLSYDPRKTIAFSFDFNVDPGVCAVSQEQLLVDTKMHVPIVGTECTGIIGEVYIPKNSNTPAVCRKLIEDWGEHQGKVLIYGDSTGGNRGSAKVLGSDWDLVKATLKPVFQDRIYFKVPSRNPNPRSRINAFNSRLLTVSGDVRLQVDPSKAPHVVKDLEGVTLLEGGSGEIDKSDLELTHLTDGLGYMIAKEFPIKGKLPTVRRVGGF